jgi:hypothetical protein
MRSILDPRTFLPALALLAAMPGLPAQPVNPAAAVTLAQNQISDYLARLADLHCTETVLQEKIAPNGHVAVSERQKFDYLIMMSGTADSFQLNESRVDADSSRHKIVALPMLVTNGVATILLVFHPYYRDGFDFKTGAPVLINGRAAVPIQFTHIQGRRTPAALALRGREYPLDLEGTAWLDETSRQVVQVEATLEHDMSDVGLRALNIHVDYAPSAIPGMKDTMFLPHQAVIDVTTPRQHWRNTHTFDDYKGFSAVVEQDPNVRLHTTDDSSAGQSGEQPPSKEANPKP